MPKLFDPMLKRSSYLRSEGSLLKFYLETRADASTPIGNTACSNLQTLVYAWLAGVDKEIAPVLPSSINWLNRAIEQGELVGDNASFHRAKLHRGRALALWLRGADQATDDWLIAYEERLAYWQAQPDMHSLRQEATQMCFEDCMAFSVQAGCFDEAIALYERWVGVRKLDLGKTMRPSEYAYAVSLHHARGHYEEAGLFEAGRRMLQRYLEADWLGNGHAVQAATWLKIIYWDRDLRACREPTLTPLQTVLKAYENMPNVAVPDFIERP